eukprot:CRZ02057.1 hypothetical protein [Spongospora subterranea]
MSIRMGNAYLSKALIGSSLSASISVDLESIGNSLADDANLSLINAILTFDQMRDHIPFQAANKVDMWRRKLVTIYFTIMDTKLSVIPLSLIHIILIYSHGDYLRGETEREQLRDLQRLILSESYCGHNTDLADDEDEDDTPISSIFLLSPWYEQDDDE